MARLFQILGRIFVRLSILGLLLWGGWWMVMDPESPLPPGWNPLEPLDVAAPETWLTGMKLRKALSSDATCLAALETGAGFSPMEPLEAGQCSIGNRVLLSSIGQVSIDPVETSCAVALRSAMWERHSLRAAAEGLGAPIREILHQGSYNCRPIRGSSTRLSTHATAEAWDVRGVVLADGRRLILKGGWTGNVLEATFWRAARDGACDWFATVLGPDYNALHADHFHLQSRGWGLCR